MATHVDKSPVRREVSGGRHFGALIVTLAPEGAWIREKGRRTAYLAPYGLLYQRAAADAARIAKAERAREREAARKAAGTARRAKRARRLPCP